MSDQQLATVIPSPVFIRPEPGEYVLESAATNPVRIEVHVRQEQTAEVYGCLHDAQTPAPPLPATLPPADPAPAGYLKFDDPVSNIFKRTFDVPANHRCAVNPATRNNLIVTLIRKETSGQWNLEPRTSAFRGVCPTIHVSVPATACPWFAYADDSPAGPSGEAIPLHRPVRVRIPLGATQVRISATGTWRHAPISAGESGPEGTGELQPLADAAYNTEIYTEGRILHPLANPRPNTLVGLPEMTDRSPGRIFPIGRGDENQPIGVQGMRSLFLAMWDGCQWNGDISNSGSVNVTLTWS